MIPLLDRRSQARFTWQYQPVEDRRDVRQVVLDGVGILRFQFFAIVKPGADCEYPRTNRLAAMDVGRRVQSHLFFS